MNPVTSFSICKLIKQKLAKKPSNESDPLDKDSLQAHETRTKRIASKNHSNASSSGSNDSKIEIAKRSTMQEKLFAYQCNRSNGIKSKNNESEKHYDCYSSTSSSSVGKMARDFDYKPNHKPYPKSGPKISYKNSRKHEDCNQKDNYNQGNQAESISRNLNENDKFCKNGINGFKPNDSSSTSDSQNFYSFEESDLVGGSLHLRAISINKNNESLYYEDRGRINEPIPWAELKSDKYNNDKRSPAPETKKSNEVLSHIDPAPQTNEYYVNFVRNSMKQDPAYEESGNVSTLQNAEAANGAILKMERMTSHKNIPKSISMNHVMKEMFLNPQEEVRLQDILDDPCVNVKSLKSFDTSEDLETNKKEIVTNQESLEEVSLNGNQMKLKKEVLKEVDGFDSFGRASEAYRRYNVKEVEEASKGTANEDKVQWRKRMIDTYTDEMFTFDKFKPPEASSELLSSSNSLGSVSSKTTSRVEDSYYKKNQLDSSLDSDDMSAARSIDSDSSSVLSRHSQMAAFAKKYKSRLSKNKKAFESKNNMISELPAEVAVKADYVESFTKSSTPNVSNDNEVEITNYNCSSKEFLLNPTVTRFLPASTQNIQNVPLEDEKESVESDSESNTCETVIINMKHSTGHDESLEMEECNKFEDTKEIKEESGYIATDKALNKIIKDSQNIEILHNDQTSHMSQCSTLVEKQVSDSSPDCSAHGEREEKVVSDENGVVDEFNIKEVETDSKNNFITKEIKDEKVNDINIIESSKSLISDEGEEEIAALHSDSDTEDKITIREIKDDEIFDNDQTIKSSKYSIDDRIEEEIAKLYPDLDFDAEFDCVNLEGFGMYDELLGRVMSSYQEVCVQAGAIEENVSKIKMIESNKDSSLEISENNYSSLDASVSSNVDTDNEPLSPVSAVDSKDIFANVEITEDHLSRAAVGFLNHKNADIKFEKGKSKKLNKRKEALMKVKKQVDHENESDIHSNGLETAKQDNSKVHRRSLILQEIKKHKLHTIFK